MRNELRVREFTDQQMALRKVARTTVLLPRVWGFGGRVPVKDMGAERYGWDKEEDHAKAIIGKEQAPEPSKRSHHRKK